MADDRSGDDVTELLGRPLPANVGSYVVERLVSPGASYSDYSARHRTLGNSLLFRHEIWPSGLSPDHDSVAALARSRRLQAELRHARVSQVVDFFREEGEWFSVFAHRADERFLSDVIVSIRARERPPCRIDEFVRISAGLTEGLAQIHRRGFVHRTLATTNVIVDDDGQPLLADVGCAARIDAEDGPDDAFRGFMRPVSAAPEQIAGEGAFSPAVDTWALGIALFELRYGRHPFWLETPISRFVLETAIRSETPAFPEIASDGPAAEEELLLRPWLARLLEKDPRRRYGDALEAHRDLEGISAELARRPVVARVFVAMPFAEESDGIWRTIRSACATARIGVNRADHSHRHESIWNEIEDSITSSDFMIAVATREKSGAFNPNVMIEIGFALALRKPVLLLTDDPEELPFDLRTRRALAFDPDNASAADFHRTLSDALGNVVAQFRTGESGS